MSEVYVVAGRGKLNFFKISAGQGVKYQVTYQIFSILPSRLTVTANKYGLRDEITDEPVLELAGICPLESSWIQSIIPRNRAGSIMSSGLIVKGNNFVLESGGCMLKDVVSVVHFQ